MPKNKYLESDSTNKKQILIQRETQDFVTKLKYIHPKGDYHQIYPLLDDKNWMNIISEVETGGQKD